VIDVTDSSSYVKRHIPGARFVNRARLGEGLKAMAHASLSPDIQMS
jgi:hypothetical protein